MPAGFLTSSVEAMYDSIELWRHVRPGRGARVDLFFAVRLRDRSSLCPDFAVQVTARL